MVSTENNGKELVARSARHETGDSLRGILDLRQEAGALVSGSRRLCNSRLDVAEIDVFVTQVGYSRGEPGIANRRRTHVNTAAPRAKVESGSDHGNLVTKRLRRHGRQG